jgi:hypothetical protein
MSTMDKTNDELYQLLTAFLSNEIQAESFVADYQSAWKRWRDSGALHELNVASSDAYDRAFTVADCYASNPTNEWEIDEEKLRFEISELVDIIDKFANG